jgi:transposase
MQPREGAAVAELPDDVEELRSIIRGKDSFIAELEKRNEILLEQVTLLKKYRFASSSEKWSEEDREQQRLFNEAESGFRPNLAQAFETEHISYTRKKRKGRRPLPDELPRTTIIHELSDEQRRCNNESCPRYGECGKLRPVIGEETREELEFIPARICVNRHVYRKYGQIDCETVEAEEEVPAVISAPREKRMVSGGMVTASLLSHVVVSKFADGLPFYRMEKIFARLGIWISRQNMCNWTIHASRGCGRYMELLWRHIREGPLINMDETTLQVLHEPGREAQRKSYMWVMVGTGAEGRRVVLYSYSPHRGGEMAERLLEGYRGSLQTDRYDGYNSVGARKEIWHVGCLAHARRKFHEADVAAKGKGLAREGLGYFKRLYRIERQLRARGLPEHRFVVERRKAAAPVWREFKRWLKSTSATVVSESLVGKAVSFALKDFQRLVRYLKYAYLTPDNNVAERAIRPYVVGRKAWLFSNTPLGAHASAAMYSIVETAKASNLDPFHFTYRLFSELPEADTEEKLEKLLPWNMTGIPPYKATREN